MSLAAGSRLGPYEIVSDLGAGGMGEVYRARDPRLNRMVAVKVLPEAVAGDARAVARFEREAKAVASLSHPNILAIHDVGEADGVHYVVTELLEGKTLRAWLGGHALAVSKAVAYATELATGLAAAHAAGIVHRDVKPENVFVTADGRIKLLDFGLAKTVSASPAENDETPLAVTTPHTVLGTAGYMAPEQVRGEEVDARSDVFAFGVVLYEMLSGRRAFGGASAAEVWSAVLRDEPPSFQATGAQVPEALERVVRRCLEKSPGERFQSAKDLAFALSSALEDLERGAESKSAAPRYDATSSGASIAVLPFLSLSPDQHDEYFADGLTEEIISVLAAVPGLKVIARTSAFAFKGTSTDVREIGERLAVRQILEGSVRRAGNRLRVTAQLVDVAGGHHLWSERYDRELEDVFAIQDQIAKAIAQRLEAGRVSVPQRERGTEDMEAYEAYMRGRFFQAKGTPEAWAKSIEYFERAIELDPGFASAHAGLGYVLGFQGFLGDRDVYVRARAEVDEALRLDDASAEAHATSGFVSLFGEWKWLDAIAALERAVALSPGLATAQGNFATILNNLGRFEQAVERARQGVALDPLSPVSLQILQFSLHQAGSFEASLEWAQKTLEVAPDYWLTHVVRGLTLLELGRFREAEEVYRGLLTRWPDEPMARAGLAQALARHGSRSDAVDVTRALEQEAAAAAGRTGQMAGSAAWACAAIDEIDRAFVWLDRAIEVREPLLTSLPTFCWWDPLRNDERFETLLRRLEYPEFSIAVSAERARKVAL